MKAKQNRLIEIPDWNDGHILPLFCLDFLSLSFVFERATIAIIMIAHASTYTQRNRSMRKHLTSNAPLRSRYIYREERERARERRSGRVCALPSFTYYILTAERTVTMTRVVAVASYWLYRERGMCVVCYSNICSISKFNETPKCIAIKMLNEG